MRDAVNLEEVIMAKYISRRNTISARSLKRRPLGSVVVRHGGSEDVRFTRMAGGWRREREDFSGLRPEVVTSAAVAAECNRSVGCRESWARVY